MPAKSDPLLHLQCFAAASLAVFVFFLWDFISIFVNHFILV